jgi:hypothetical protein
MSIAIGIAERLDEIGKPAWLALMILGFALYWPLGLALLAFLLWSGRMGCWKHARFARWRDHHEDATSRWPGQRAAAPSSGNRAFDAYREETLRRLEDEQREFVTFLDRLRLAKDKAEFDEFLAERRRQQPGPAPGSQG